MKQVESLPDSSAIATDPSGRWDLTLPSGRHVTGKAADEAKALAHAHRAHNAFVLQSWAKGNPIAGQRWCSPST